MRRQDVTDPARVTPLTTPSVPPTTELHAVAYSADATLLAAGAADAVTQVWRLDGTAVGQAGSGTIPAGATGTVSSLAFAPDGRTLAAGSADRTVYLWGLATDPGTTGTAPTLTPQPPITGPTGWVNAVAFSPDGATLVGGSSDSLTWQWELATSRPGGNSSIGSIRPPAPTRMERFQVPPVDSSRPRESPIDHLDPPSGTQATHGIHRTA